MTDQAREARKIYKREWNRKNRDKVKAAQERYWEKRAQRVARAGEPQTQAAQQEEGE